MKVLKAANIKAFDNFTCLIYSRPGIGKTSMLKSIKGKTILFSTDGMYQVLSGLDHIDIVVMDSKKPSDDLGNFYKYVVKNLDEYDNIVIDNLSTFQKFWLNLAGKETGGMPRIQDYGIVDRVLLDFVASLKDLKKNVLIFAHERKVEVTRANGGTYHQAKPDIRNLDAIMGIIPLVGRLVIVRNQESQEDERVIVLQPTQATDAKDQLTNTGKKTIGQMELLPLLQGQ